MGGDTAIRVWMRHGFAAAISLAAMSLPTAAPASGVFLLDSTDSMSASIGQTNRADLLRTAIGEALSRVGPENWPALVSFGEGTPQSCTGAKTISPQGQGGPAAIAALSKLAPGGQAAISRALSAAAGVAGKSGEARHIVIFADGPDECGPDPCATAAALKAADSSVRIHVVDLSGSDGETQGLACMARNTGGTYVGVRERNELIAAIDSTVRLAGNTGADIVANASGKAATQSAGDPLAPGYVPPPIVTTPATETAGGPVAPDNTDELLTGAVSAGQPETGATNAAARPGETTVPAVGKDTRPAYLIENTKVSKGKEGILLRAQITRNTGTITRPVDWDVYRIEDIASKKWRQVGSQQAPDAFFQLEPGHYVVRASYGAVRAAKLLTVEDEKVTDTTFILNAGALRVLPALAFLDPPEGTTAKHWVFRKAAKPGARRKLVAEATRPREVVRLNAGPYVLVSRLGKANATVETNITIRPGLLTEVEINHKAGVATFAVTGSSADKPLPDAQWELKDGKGKIVVRSKGGAPSHVLAPGQYVMTARLEGKSYESAFRIDIGEALTVEIDTK